jgi:hypothetical protein
LRVLSGSLFDVAGEPALPKRPLAGVTFAGAVPNNPFVVGGVLVASERLVAGTGGAVGALRLAKGFGLGGA